jgi:hypothetical protein
VLDKAEKKDFVAEQLAQWLDCVYEHIRVAEGEVAGEVITQSRASSVDAGPGADVTTVA